MAICSDYPGIFHRHRGPYSLLMTRETPVTKRGETKIVPTQDKQRGPMSAEDAHETARMLVGDPRDNVKSIFVYSDGEGQFIGAFYEKGQDIPSWATANERYAAKEVDSGRVDQATYEERPEQVALLPAGEESLPAGDAPQRPATAARPARVERVQRLPAAAGPGVRKRGGSLVLDDGNAEAWPKSAGAQIVRGWFEQEPGRRATAKEIVEAIGAQLNAAGVEFPASLVSRLKQAGFLKEVDA